MCGPDRVHPQQRDRKYDFSSRARHLKYYFIDFCLSDIYESDDLPEILRALEEGG
ncbi:uncharacterized protein BT62DRAFT_932984 [Guyanagaster necrorhizus]|uniref:Uncharacterized protein n=1 Tax=Guyanagaster necrorhizus TaxID=856835 RepID=A0A9P8ASB9_9AGAR|nr:uncharacterized protein BT62DRAFT_932984 [Guyanagaster necrorhizus MCA 3950]KAG7445821.1 hypothetical protein BT62DRAFT_932984 [Guyanagaster necrorhizus MCA 3950]